MKTKLTMQIPEVLEVCDVEITGVVILPDDEYKAVLVNGQLPGRYYDRLNRYTKVVTATDSFTISEYKALLILGENSEDGIAVCGKNYVAYASIFPGAKEWLDRHIEKMADFVCSLKDVPDYSHHLVPLEMVGDYGKADVTSDNGIGKLLLKRLQERDEITGIIMQQDCFEINYLLDYRQETLDTSGELASLCSTPHNDQHMIIDPDGIPAAHLQSRCAIDLIASYENLLPIQAQERLTYYFGDLGMHVKKHGVTDEQLRPVYAEALQTISMSSQAYLDRKFAYRGEVESYMRCCMIAKILKPNNEIVFIPPSPTGRNGQWQYEVACVVEVDASNRNCVVSFEDGEVTIPFRYVLARFCDQGFVGSAFGFEQAEPIFGLSESWRQYFLLEAQREYEQQNIDGQEMADEDESPGMVMI